jgi:uncharacterized protein
VGKNYTQKQVEDLAELSNANSRFELYEIGNKAAENEVKKAHFPDAFKI